MSNKITLTNRFTGKTATMRLKVVNGLVTVTDRQYKNCVAKIGHGPIKTDVSFVAIRPNGTFSTCLDAQVLD